MLQLDSLEGCMLGINNRDLQVRWGGVGWGVLLDQVVGKGRVEGPTYWPAAGWRLDFVVA